MKCLRKSITAAVIGLGVLSVTASPSLAGSADVSVEPLAKVQIAHAGQGQGYGMGGHGMGGSGMMGSGMMGSSMGGQGMMSPGMHQGHGNRVVPMQDLSIDDVRHFFDHRLAMHGNDRVKVGEVTQTDEHTIIANIVTVDESLVQRFKVDRHTGRMKQVTEIEKGK